MQGLRAGPQPHRSLCKGPPTPERHSPGVCSPPTAGRLLWDTRLFLRAPRKEGRLLTCPILWGPGIPETPLLPVCHSQISFGPAGGHSCLHDSVPAAGGS